VSSLVPRLYHDVYHAGRINRGHGRYVSQKHGIKVHRSVKIRMRAYSRNNKKYAPKAKIDLQKEEHEWVD